MDHSHSGIISPTPRALPRGNTDGSDKGDHYHFPGDFIYSGRDSLVYHIYSTSQLKYQLLENTDVLSTRYFATGRSYSDLLAKANSFRSILLLVGDRDTGKRETALQVLKNTRKQVRSIFQVFPDWDDDLNASRIPSTKKDGFLLDLNDSVGRISESFIDSLDKLAVSFHSNQSLLIILVPRNSWSKANETKLDELSSNYLDYVIHSPPSSIDIAQMHLKDSHRYSWISAPESVFSGLISESTPPRDSVELARIIRQARDKHDSDAVDEYLSWRSRIETWFFNEQSEDIELRGTLISLSFLDGEEDQVILDAKDILLSDRRINWSHPEGGVLGGKGGSHIFDQLGLAPDERNRISIRTRFPGIDEEIISNIWEKRPQLIPVLTDWLSSITHPDGLAPGKTQRISEVLTKLAERQGPSKILSVLERWTESDVRTHRDMSLQALDDMSVNTYVGARVRQSLTDWARGTKKPRRQRAALDLAARKLGSNYPHVALTRIRYVIERAESEEVKNRAYKILADFATTMGRVDQVVLEITDWLNSENPTVRRSGQASFRKLFTYEDTQSGDVQGERSIDQRSENIRLILESLEKSKSLDSLVLAWFCYWYSSSDVFQVYKELNSVFLQVNPGSLPWKPVEKIAQGIFSALEITPTDGSMQVFFGSSSSDAFTEHLFAIWRSSWTR